jgi:hypothetical protein
MKSLVISISFVILSGCATPSQQYFAQQLGPDTYVVTVPYARPIPGTLMLSHIGMFRNSADAQTASFKSAKLHCEQQRKEVLVNNTRIGADFVDVVFRCLGSGDPELKRPEFRQAPAITIEDARR